MAITKEVQMSERKAYRVNGVWLSESEYKRYTLMVVRLARAKAVAK